ncbi:MAG: primase-helicase family protein [Steroidobacteraceae bacterium]
MQSLDEMDAAGEEIPEPPEWMNEAPPPEEQQRRVLPDAVTVQDFHAYMPAHSYLYTPTREPWPAASVNSRIPPIDIGAKKPIPASAWLDRFRPVEQMTWCPGLPMVIEDKLISGGGWIERPGVNTFNLYLPPTALEGDKDKADPWLEHVVKVFPGEAGHIVHWLAHRVQRPSEKINHAIVFLGDQGIGKDSILEPVKYAIGPWNFAEVSPAQLLGRFTGFMKSVILRISEARDLGDVDRYAFYEHTKVYTAAPPDVLRCDEKFLREHAVMNVCGVVITTNHIDGIYLPPDDRRHFVAGSDLKKEDFPADYWRDLHGWYRNGGIEHVAAYLASLDLSSFDPKAPPPKTAAFWRCVNAGRAPEDGEVADALEALKNPPAITIDMIAIYTTEDFRLWLKDRRNSRQIPHRLKDAGYVAVENASARDGLWKLDGRRQVIYARRELAERDRIAAATNLAREGRA